MHARPASSDLVDVVSPAGMHEPAHPLPCGVFQRIEEDTAFDVRPALGAFENTGGPEGMAKRCRRRILTSLLGDEEDLLPREVAVLHNLAAKA